jgi:hypothetical protein
MAHAFRVLSQEREAMKKHMPVCALVLAIGCVGKGGFTLGGESTTSSAAPAPAESSSSSSSGRSVDDVVNAARAKPVKDFDPDAFYVITTTVKGREYALTFVPPENLERGESITNNASKSKVELRELSNDPTQHWQLNLETIDPGHIYSIFSKVSDLKERLTGALVVSNPDHRFTPSDAYRQKHNRLTVGMYLNETRGYWHVVAAGNGKFRIRSLLGHTTNLNKPNEREWPEKWNEERALEVIDDGGIRVVHGTIAEKPAQHWKVTKVGY